MDKGFIFGLLPPKQSTEICLLKGSMNGKNPVHEPRTGRKRLGIFVSWPNRAFWLVFILPSARYLQSKLFISAEDKSLLKAHEGTLWLDGSSR